MSTKQGCNQASRQRSRADEGLKAGLEGVKGMEAGFKAGLQAQSISRGRGEAG